jgi:hypothetical protein
MYFFLLFFFKWSRVAQLVYGIDYGWNDREIVVRLLAGARNLCSAKRSDRH